MNSNLKIYILVLSFPIFSNSLANDSKGEIVSLSSPVLHLIDGITGLMDEHTVHKTLHMGRELSKLQYGNVDAKTKKRIPQYEYCDKLYTLHELACIERDHMEMAAQNIVRSSHELEQIKKNTDLLANILQKIKSDFESITNPFLHEARGTRQQMIQLISESCQKRNRTDSLLLNWSEGTENESFKRDVTSLQKLDQFCTDLTNFLKDMINSCPRALTRFHKWNKQQNNK